MIHDRTDYQSRIKDSANEIGEDEPVFLLRAQDDFFIPMLIEYVKLNETTRGDGRMPRIKTRMTMSLIKHIELAKEWRRTHKTKMPDMPESAVLDVVARRASDGGNG